MHEKYTTPGFVVGSRSSREADKMLRVFTQDFGMISGVLLGVRNIKSKLKGFTENGVSIEVTLVRGKHSWRITDIVASTPFKIEKQNLASFLRLLLLLRKLVQGEEKNDTLFESLTAVFKYLSKRPLSVDSQKSLELIGAARILSALGYGKEMPKNISIEGAITDADLLQVATNKTKLAKLINLSLSESQLMHRVHP